MKGAVVGFGKMGMLHASLLNRIPDVKITTICENSSLVRKVGHNVLDFKFVDDIEKIESVDFVYVTTPPATHFNIIKQLYLQGIYNIFCEKPLTMNLVDSRDVVKLAVIYEGVNMVGYNRRFSVTFRKAKQILDCGILGELVGFDGYAYSANFLGKQIPENLNKIGVMRDLGCHVIDLALWYFGSLDKGKIDASWQKDGYRLPEIGLHICCSRGELFVNEDKVVLGEQVWYKQDLEDKVAFFLGSSDYIREDEEFIKAILENRQAKSDFQSASEVDGAIEELDKCLN
jgi:predicted dehydrogenase